MKKKNRINNKHNTCKACKKVKPTSNFYKFYANRGSYISSYCKDCVKDKARKYQASHPELIRIKSHKYWHAHKCKCHPHGQD